MNAVRIDVLAQSCVDVWDVVLITVYTGLIRVVWTELWNESCNDVFTE